MCYRTINTNRNNENSKYPNIDQTSKSEWRRSTEWIYRLLADRASYHSWICCVSYAGFRPLCTTKLYSWSLPDNNFRHDLLIAIMEEPCFDFLRTKKTLGYTVFPMCRCTYGIIGSSITVRSQRDKFTVEQVHQYVKEFLKEFKKILKNMKSPEFEGM